MNSYSVGVMLALEIGCYEAASKNSAFIEVDHIMLGILSLDKVIKGPINAENIDVMELINETERLYKRLTLGDQNIVLLRRTLRRIIPEGDGIPRSGIFHRSNDCKSMFNAAICLSNNLLTINHLFFIISKWKTSYIKRLLAENEICVNEFDAELLFHRYSYN